MRRAAALALLLCGAAHADPGLGRLFLSPPERAQLDARRGASQQQAEGGAPGQQPALPTPGPGAEAMPAPLAAQASYPPAAPPSYAPAGAAVAAAPVDDLAASMPPGTIQVSPSSAAPPPGAPGVAPGAVSLFSGPIAAASVPGTPAGDRLVLNGVARSSSGRTLVWLNNTEQTAAGATVSVQGATPSWSVPLSSGRRLTLLPGQRYDIQSGAIDDDDAP